MNVQWIRSAALVAGLAVAAPAAAAELRLYSWADYTAPALVAKFERETGIKVVIDTFDSAQDMLDTLGRGNTGYDLAVASEYSVSALIQKKLVEKAEPSRLPGFDRIEENWRGQHYDPGNDYAMPWQWGTTGFVVDTAAYQGDVDTLALLFEPPPEIKSVGFIDDADDVVTVALRYLGLPRCNGKAADLAKVEELLLRGLKQMRLVDPKDPVAWLVKTKAPVSMAWNGDAMRARKGRPALQYAYPREGTAVWTDTLVVPKGARNKEQALAFMGFLLMPENAALQSNFSGYANTVRGSDALLSDELRAAPEVIIPPRAKLEFLQACPSATYDNYRKLWTRVKAAAKAKK